MLSVMLTRPGGNDHDGASTAAARGGGGADAAADAMPPAGAMLTTLGGPIHGDTLTQSWAKIAGSAWWALCAFGLGGFVYITMAMFETNWRNALDSFVGAASLWLMAIFLLRFRRAVSKLVVTEQEDGEWLQNMVRTMQELSDTFEVLRMLSILYLLRYCLLLCLFLVGLLGFFESEGG